MPKIHFVYHLVEKKEIVYVGRSIRPKARQTKFETKHGFRPGIIIFGPFEFKPAQELEKRDIVKFSPTYNIYVASSPARLGRRNSKEHNLALQAARKGVPLSAEHKAKLWRDRPRPIGKLNWFYGKKHTPATIEKVREANRLQFADPVKAQRHREAVQAGMDRRRALGLPLGRANSKEFIKKNKTYGKTRS